MLYVNKAMLLLTALLTLLNVTACAQESKSENIIIGAWARSTAECSRPELIFQNAKITINIDADGSPVAFDYEHIDYISAPHQILVKLNSRHPYGKTPDKMALTFDFINDNTMRMQQLKNRSTEFVRCVKK